MIGVESTRFEDTWNGANKECALEQWYSCSIPWEVSLLGVEMIKLFNLTTWTPLVDTISFVICQSYIIFFFEMAKLFFFLERILSRRVYDVWVITKLLI
jgi:DNA integrity scanning protein DisA with diadenylate cyclase activity